MYSGLFPMTRIVYSMSTDGLIYDIFSILLPKLKTPIVATLATGFLTGIWVYTDKYFEHKLNIFE